MLRTEGGLCASWREACALADVDGVTFPDLHGTPACRLAPAGATPAEIAKVTDHALKDVKEALDAHYVSRGRAISEAAIRKQASEDKSP